MSRRLQVLLDENELLEIRKIARQRRMSVSEWVREGLRASLRQARAGDARKKLDAVRTAVKHSFPTCDIDQMLAEMARGGSSALPGGT